MYRVRSLAALIAIAVVVLAAVPTHSLEAGDTLIYQLDFSMKMSCMATMKDIDIRASGTVKTTIVNITEDYITIHVEPNLNIEGLPPEYSDIFDEINEVQTITVSTSNALGPFNVNEEGVSALSKAILLLQGLYYLVDFNETKVEVAVVAYKGIPAIKLKIYLRASNYRYNFSTEVHAIQYLDMATSAVLYSEVTAKSFAPTSEYELLLKIELMNPDVLQQLLEWYEVEVEGGDRFNVAFAAEGLSVGEPEVTSDRVIFPVSGEGLGQLIIGAERGAPEPEVYVDGRPVNKHKIATADDGKTYYKVPIKFSQHEVMIVFGKPVLGAAAIEPSLPTEGGGMGSILSGPYMTLIIALVIIVVIGIAVTVAIKMVRKKRPGATPSSVPETPSPRPYHRLRYESSIFFTCGKNICMYRADSLS